MDENSKEIYVKGLLPVLSKFFWPDYEFIPSAYKKKGNKTGISNRFEGLYRGDIVHKQLELYVNKGGIKSIHLLFNSIHPFTKKAIIALNLWKWVPIVSEFTIYDENLNLATRVDLLCLDESKDIVLVEWKCGMDNYVNRGNKPMKGPLKESYSNSPSNQAYLQLLFTKLIIEYTYDVRIKKSYIVRIFADGIEPYFLPKLLSGKANIVYQYLIDSLNFEKKKKKKEKKNKIL